MPTENGPTTGAERVRRHHDKQRKRGLMHLRVWVPSSDAQRVRDFARELRTKACLLLPEDPSSPWTYVRVDTREKLLRKIIKENGGEWSDDVEAWRIPANLVAELGLSHRVVS